MGLIIQQTDFIGQYLTPNHAGLIPFIERYESKYLAELLGVELFELFKEDINPISKEPENPMLQNIYFPFLKQFNDNLEVSDGIKDMLLGFIFFEFVRQNKFKSTDGGVLVYKSQEGREITQSELHSFLRQYYNRSVLTYQAIQWWIMQNKTDYPTYSGIYKKFDLGL
jgi:hypothetical protein